MTRSPLRTRTAHRATLRSVALGALVLGLATGCGAPLDPEADPTAEPAAEQAGGDDAAEFTGGASDDGGAAEATTAESTDAAATTLPADADLATAQLPIPAAEAASLGMAAVGGGELVRIEIDHNDTAWEWELEIVLDGREHELDIDATTGEVTQHDEDDDAVGVPAVSVESPMTPEQAIAAALEVETGRVSGWDLESEDGRIHYTVDIERSGGDDDVEVEVEVDVETGETRVDD